MAKSGTYVTYVFHLNSPCTQVWRRRGGGMVHSKGGNCNYIAINPAMRNMGHWGKEMGRVRAKGLRSPGLQSLEK